jgi:predicted metal-dependent phosphoesterase TrpH
MTLIKADLHIHTSEEIFDTFIDYSIKDVINRASELKYGVLALTLHNKVYPVAEIKKYAAKKGILLIQGVEAAIEGRHTLIYNITLQEFKKIKTFNDLRTLKKKNKKIFVIAPHPFNVNIILKISLRKKYFENKDLFDALELHPNCARIYNPNKKTKRVAAIDGKPLAANSDLHFLSHFGQSYSIVDVKGELTEKSFFDAIRQKKITVVNKPKKTLNFLRTVMQHLFKKEI